MTQKACNMIIQMKQNPMYSWTFVSYQCFILQPSFNFASVFVGGSETTNPPVPYGCISALKMIRISCRLGPNSSECQLSFAPNSFVVSKGSIFLMMSTSGRWYKPFKALRHDLLWIRLAEVTWENLDRKPILWTFRVPWICNSGTFDLATLSWCKRPETLSIVRKGVSNL